MSAQGLIYKTGTATENDIHLHLTECNDSFVPPLTTRVSIADYSKKIYSYAVTFEAWKDQKLVGLIAAYYNQEHKFGFITNVSVLKEHMGAGIASELLNQCVNYSIKHHYTEIRLEVFKNNIPAVNFYKKYNFIQTSIKDDFIIMNHKLNYN